MHLRRSALLVGRVVNAYVHFTMLFCVLVGWATAILLMLAFAVGDWRVVPVVWGVVSLIEVRFFLGKYQ